MSGTDWLVIAGGLAAIASVNWHFFFAGRTAAEVQANGEEVAEVRIAVRGGYEPATVRVKAGTPVRGALIAEA
jgi:plastocyanin domain-containing protein